MCKIGIMLGTAGENLPSAILFMNSNKSEKNIRKRLLRPERSVSRMELS